jgi:hypothetical protein
VDDISEVVIDKCHNATMNVVAADVNLCATGDQSLSPGMDESIVSEDSELVRTADRFQGKCGNTLRGWPISAINSHLPFESGKQWQDISGGNVRDQITMEHDIGGKRRPVSAGKDRLGHHYPVSAVRPK